MDSLEKLISFKISGKFAHFKKFYTNSSSLSYLIPPRTVIIGMLASFLKMDYNSYYDIFNENFCKISVRISGDPIKRKMQSLNYLHSSHYAALMRGTESRGFHSQCKLELLMSDFDKNICYEIFVGFSKITDIVTLLEKKLTNQDTGYGLYLGQRQFRGSIGDVTFYDKCKLNYPVDGTHLDSIITIDNIVKYNSDDGLHIINERMPIQMQNDIIEKKIKNQKVLFNNGREVSTIKSVVFEKNGKRIFGEFKNCCKVNNKLIISFF